MTDSTASDPVSTIPDPTIVDPSTVNGQCDPTDQQPPKRASQGEPKFKMDQEMKISDSVEGQGLLESSMRLKPHEAQSYRKKALWVSWVSIFVTLILAVAAFTVSFMRHSASAFGFAFDAALDVLSSIIVVWRYSNAAAVHSAHREYIACVILGVVFILSSLCILGKAIHDLATKLLPEVVNDAISCRYICTYMCSLLLLMFKLCLSTCLSTCLVRSTGFNSLVGGVMGFSILISAEVFKHDPKVWYLDGSIGVLIGLIILAYGVKLLVDMVPRVRQTRNYERFE
ncbi:transmembrane protein 163a [Salvelinus sp. IW2-2015]|uniref:transmembrane protein 163a n=1 Tax=Salvelinus sp. IW2-2015 TaxID=2691554 RepID=UPI000CDF7C05|nr:transmembrane protein 163 [Salvelinus alpinus]